MQSNFYILITRMRVYLQSESLGEAIAKALAQMDKTQNEAAKELKRTQGQVSHLLSGDFKTKNGLVIQVCKYVNIDPDTFKRKPSRAGVDRKAIEALGRACGGHKRKTAAVIRVLRALETFSSSG